MTDTPKRIGLVSNGLGGWRLWSKDEPNTGGRDYPDAEYILATEHDRIVAEKDAEIARLKYKMHEASDPDFLFGAMDNVNDFDVPFLTDFANAASRAIRAALGDHHED